MPTADPIQTSFLGGEIAGSLRGQTESPLYKSGLSFMRNAMPRTQGSAVTRPGSIKVNSEGGKLIGFRSSFGDDYLVRITAGKVYILDANGPVKQMGPNGMPPLDSGGFKAGVDATVGAGYYKLAGTPTIAPATIAPPPNNSLVLTMKHGDTVRINATIDGTSDITHIIRWLVRWSGAGIMGNLSVAVHVGTSPGGTELYDGGMTVGGNNAPLAWQDSLKNYPGLHFAGSEGTSTVYIDLIATRLTGAVADTQVEITVPRLQPIEDLWNAGITAPWTDDQLDALQWSVDTGKDRIIIVHPEVAPYVVERKDFPRDSKGRVPDSIYTLFNYAPPPANAEKDLPQDWRCDPAIFTGMPAEWGEGNWPGVVEQYQGRLWLAGTPADLNKFWASKSGNLFDFTIPAVSPTVTYTMSDAFTFDVQTKGRICWFKGKQKLLCGTDMGDYSITSQGGVVWAADIQVKLESNFGSAQMMAVAAGDQVLFVSTDRRKIYAINFDLNTDAWQSLDITFPGEHLTKARIRSFAFLRDPYNLIVAVLDDGSFIACTYSRARGAAAWWRWQDAGLSAIQYVAASDGPTGSTLWFSGTDPVVTVGFSRIMRVPLGTDELFLDFQNKFTMVEGQDWDITSYPDRRIYVFKDGALWRIVEPGAATVRYTAAATEQMVTGFPIPFKMVTLKPEAGGQRGSAQSTHQRWVRVFLRLYDSALPLVNGERAQAARTPQMDVGATPLPYSGDTETVTYGDDDNGVLTIENDVPFRTEVLAIFGTLMTSEA